MKTGDFIKLMIEMISVYSVKWKDTNEDFRIYFFDKEDFIDGYIIQKQNSRKLINFLKHKTDRKIK